MLQGWHSSSPLCFVASRDGKPLPVAVPPPIVMGFFCGQARLFIGADGLPWWIFVPEVRARKKNSCRVRHDVCGSKSHIFHNDPRKVFFVRISRIKMSELCKYRRFCPQNRFSRRAGCTSRIHSIPIVRFFHHRIYRRSFPPLQRFHNLASSGTHCTIFAIIEKNNIKSSYRWIQ